MMNTNPSPTPAGEPAAAGTRTVVVTGAAGGLGRAFALGFQAAGERVVVADVDHSGAEETAELLREAGGEALSVAADVTSVESTEALAARAAEFGGGGVDVLVNNAAVYAGITRATFEDLDPAEWDRVMAVNLKGPWLCTKALSPHFRPGSHVVNLASATVFSGSAQWAHYVASKSGVIGLTRVLAKELGPRGITVNAIAPGFTLTDASHALIENAAEYGVERSSLKRPSEPEDVVGAALFLAGPGSGYISGQTLVVDGGRQFI